MTQYHIAPHKPTVIRIGDGTPPAYAALGGDTPENLLDYAAFMVRACNSHYSILEALEEMRRNGRKQGWGQSYAASMEKADAAIAQAKETTND